MPWNVYKRWPKIPDSERVANFLRDKCATQEDGCIVYTGKAPKADGHVQLSFGGRQLYIHRFVYATLKGEIPKGMVVCHRCDNPRCVNIDHLWLGTPADNNRDMHRKGRSNYSKARKTHCKHGHEFTPENTAMHGGFRQCRECNRLRQRRDYVRPEKAPLTRDQLRQQRYRVRRKARLAANNVSG
jgi:hypothetical protein